MFHPEGPTFLELVRQALSSTDRGYDLLARKFDYTPFRTPDWILDAVAPHLGQVSRAVDLCCGTGAAMRMLRPHCEREVVGIDRSQGMLDEAKRRLENAPGDAALRFVQGDVLDSPFEVDFDLATCFGAFGHILEEDEARFVYSVWRALAPHGRFLFVTAEPPSNLSPAVWIARTFNAAMHVRNALWKPPFVMYYLTFLLPRAQALLEATGFDVTVTRGLFGPHAPHLVLVDAVKRR